MTASISEIGAKLSSTAVMMCTTKKASASSELERCRPSTAKRGQRRVARRPMEAIPMTSAIVSRISATAPLARVRYQ
jgi:hypothetical protein